MARVSRFVPSRSAGLLSECQKIAAERFPGFLKMVFDKADDHLFDIANKADNSRRQTIFFDAMRELRLKRTALESGFMDNLKKEFQSSLDLSNDTHKTSTKTLSLELSLVAHDDVEETLAVTNFIESIRTRCKEELFALDQRMQHLLSDPDFEPNHNPFGPHTIGNAFRTTCQQLESGIEVKLTMFKLFDKLANTGINSLYRDLNQHLIRQDVLPKLMPSVHRHGDRGGKTRVIIETEDSQTEATGPDVFSTLQQLMLTQPNPSGFIAGGQRPVAGNMGANPSHFQPGFVGGNARLAGPGGSMNAGAAHYATPDGGPAASGGGGSSQAAAVTTSHFVNSLTQLQHGNSAAFDGAMQPFSGEIFQAGNVNVLHTLRSNGFANDLNQTDNLTLDIVSILFDYILDDPAIPDAMKALIGRLQIPILKVALMDKELFSKKSHPARRLLDGLAEAALGWSETSPQQDDLYQVVEGIVKEIVGEFDSDMSLFSVLLERLDTFLQEDARTARQRAEESARSLHARERIVVAKMTVDDAVNARLGQSEVRTFIRQFVLDYWRQLLIVTHVEAGADSPEWQRQLGVVDDLVWSVQPKATPGDRKALTEKLPQLVKQLKLGMKALEMEPAICSKFLTMLASVHVVSVKQVEEATLAERRVTAQAAAPEPTLPPAAASEEEFVKQALGRLFERKAIDTTELDIDLTAFAPAESAEDDSPADAVDEFFDLVMTLDLGDWVEFTSSDGAVTRARFTWISPATGRYLFTTRQGHKALDLTMAGLAALFRAGDARKIDAQPDPIFDRAIGELMERLEQQSTAH